MVIGLLSMIIVTPLLTSFPAVYGIYSVCISLTIFLSYADIGFLGAGLKYASESYSQGNLHEEIKIIGFTIFILSVFVLMFSFSALFLSFNPDLLITKLENSAERDIASRLLLILSLFSPLIILQRCLQLIFGIRLEDYVFQRILMIPSAIKILSVLYFFQANRYDIVGYYLFSQIITVATIVYCFLLAKKKYNYDIGLLFRSIRFNRDVLNKTKTIAFNSLYVTVLWVFFFEIDSVIIIRYLGPLEAAYYAVGFTILSFFRSILSIIYGPFQTRFNHFIGNNNIGELNKFFENVIVRTIPIVVIPILTFVLLADHVIIAWVGMRYEKSIIVAQLLSIGYMFTFITQPTSIYLTAIEKIKPIYFIITAMLLIYWGGVFLTINSLGLLSFPLSKLIAFIVSALCYGVYALKNTGLNIMSIAKGIAFPIIATILILIIVDTMVPLPIDKSKVHLLIFVSLGGFCTVVGILLYYFTSKDFRNYIDSKIDFKKMLVSIGNRF